VKTGALVPTERGMGLRIVIREAAIAASRWHSRVGVYPQSKNRPLQVVDLPSN
jgi:hypothetical protein